MMVEDRVGLQAVREQVVATLGGNTCVDVLVYSVSLCPRIGTQVARTTGRIIPRGTTAIDVGSAPGGKL